MRAAAKQEAVSPDRILWTAGVVAGASVPHWITLAGWVPALLTLCVIWRLAGEFRGWPLPGALMRIALAFVAFIAVLAQYRTINGVEAGSALLVVMVALKFLESHTHRDQLVLTIISYFLVFASLLYERSLATVLYLLGFVWFTTVGLLQLSRRGPLLRSRPTGKLAARLLLQAIPIMIVLFLLFPRLPGPLWGIPGTNTSARSGLSDTMNPGDVTDLALSDGVAFRVEFDGRPPGPQQLYWRGPVLSNFNGRTWSSDGPGMRRPMTETIDYFGDPVEYRVMLEPHGRRWVFALDMPQRWTADEDIRMDKHYQLFRFPRAIRTRFDYRLTSFPEYQAREELTSPQLDHYLRLPQGSNPRTQALGRSWAQGTDEPREIIAKAFEFFAGELFYYTLTPPALGAHASDEFLFEAREGFCEHYASAFTILMRAAGIPARVVTGYQGGELNSTRLGEYFIIRHADAHAWTEIWTAAEGWIRVDPTAAVAPDRIAFGLSRTALAGDVAPGTAFRFVPWARDLALAWDAMNIYWNDWVLGYGPQLQNALLRSLGFAEPHWSKLVMVGAFALTLLMGALTALLAWSYRRTLHRDAAARCFAAFCGKLRRAAVAPRRPDEGPVNFGQRAALALPAASREIDEIVASYVKARYEGDQDGTQLQLLRNLVRAFKPLLST